MRRTVRRGTTIAFLTTAAMLVVAAPAAAHVTVNPREATQGGFARLDFRVPNERSDDATTQLEVHFPEDAPIPSVSTAPMPGWRVEVTRRTLDEPIEGGHDTTITEVVGVVTWTAEDETTAIQPGQFGEFGVSLGPLPEVDELFFPALQTYASGDVVRWIELPEDGDELEHPAPRLTLVPAEPDPGSTEPAAGTEDPPAAEDPPAGEGSAAGGDSSTGTRLGLAGLLAGLAGLLAGLAGVALGGAAFVRTRSR